MEKLMKRILELVRSGYAITIAPGPYPKVFDIHIRKDNHQIRTLCDINIIPIWKTEIEFLYDTIEMNVWKLHEAEKGEK